MNSADSKPDPSPPGSYPLEALERRKRRDPEIRVWDRFVRAHHWLLVLAFATLYLEFKKFPLHPYAGYLVCFLIPLRIAWGFFGKGAARFSSFWFRPREIISYTRDALRGKARYYYSHNPMGALMVYMLMGSLALNCMLGLLAYSASQQLGPLGSSIPSALEDQLIAWHTWLGHATAVLVVGHLGGVVWAARLHRENYVLAMVTGLRRIPRAVALPVDASHPEMPVADNGKYQRLLVWLKFKHPFIGTILLMLLVAAIAYPLIYFLVTLNKILPAY